MVDHFAEAELKTIADGMDGPSGTDGTGSWLGGP